MPDPLTREEYTARLADLDQVIENARPYYNDYVPEEVRPVVNATNQLTEALLACAKGIRLLAEPPPIEVAEARGQFTLVETPDETTDEESR